MIQEGYLMVLLCAICCCINYADRVNMSVAIISIGEHYNYSVEEQGIIMSYFFLGYLPMQLGGAILCRRFGGKRVLTYGAFFWSIFTMLTPVACEFGYYPLLLCRVLMGFSEGVAFPGIFHFLSAWIPANERARSISMVLTGVHVGTTMALILSPVIIRYHSWQWIFYGFGTGGILWIIPWHFLAYDRENVKQDSEGSSEVISEKANTTSDLQEDKTPFLSSGPGVSHGSDDSEGDSDRTHSIQAKLPSASGKLGQTTVPFTFVSKLLSPSEVRAISFMLSDKRCLAVCLSQALYGFVHYTIMSWLPSYFKHVYNAETTDLSFTFMPYFTMALSANFGGFMADRLLLRGMHISKVRKIVTLVANVGASVMLLAFSFAPTVPIALTCISIAMAFMSFNTGGFENAFLDNAEPRLSGLFKAVANTMSSFSGFVAVPFATIVLRWSSSWRFVFGSLGIWFILLAIVYCRYGSGERILTEESR